MTLRLLLAWAALAGPAPAPASAPREVVRSTAPLAGLPSEIPELKRRIHEDQEAVRKARAAVKRAEKGKHESQRRAAREAWLQARERLRTDKALLRKAVDANEAELRAKARARERFRKGESFKP
ncbi:MAG: hypothetical protein HY553_09895 [Elusimicrobia bacterium]|nr:hypothetical protein [Elusimicrobiota bacterium]